MSRNTLARTFPTRIAYRVRAGVFLALVGMATVAWAQKGRVLPPPPRRNNAQQSKPAPAQQAPVERPPMNPANTMQASPGPRPATAPLVAPGHPLQMAGHLGTWMEAHRNLTLEQQHTALDAEPGFRTLQPAEQAALHQQLTRLNRMPPEQQQQRMRYTEEMETLAPPQRQQVRNVLGQLGSLPEDRQIAVKRAYKQLRDLPEGQRQAYMNSPQFRAQFNEQERMTVGNMVNSAPLLRRFESPPPTPHED